MKKSVIVWLCFTLIVGIGLFSITKHDKNPKNEIYAKIMAKKVIDCGYFTWAPYVVKDPNTGALSGINYDIMEEIGNNLGVKINWKEEVSAGTALEGLNTKRYDVMCATLWPDKARLQNSLMSSPEFYSTLYVVVRQNDGRFDNNLPFINSPDVTIVGIEGDVTYTLAKEEFPKAKLLALPQTSNGSEMFQNLVSKKADVVILDKGSINDFNKTNKDSVRIVSGIPPIAKFPETLAVRKGEDKLMSMLNDSLKALKNKGFIEKMIQKYKPYGVSN